MDKRPCEAEVQLAHLTLCSLEMIHGSRSQKIKQMFTALFSYPTKLQ
jgi:hypothetical protein